MAAIIAEFTFMPLIGLWSNFCPKNLEGTSITIFTGYLNTTANFSNYLGALIIWLSKIHKTDFSKIWILVLIQNTYLLFVLILMFFIKFPKFENK